MTITLDLKPEEFTVLNERAQAQGVDIETVLHRLVEQISTDPKPAISEKNKAAIALMDAWSAEKHQLTDEQIEQNDRDFEDFKTNINRWRSEEGRPPAF